MEKNKKNNLTEKNNVEMDKRLVGLAGEHFGLLENRLFYTFLSKLDPRHPETRVVEFSKSEFERLWGLNSRIKAPVLEAAIKNLMQPLTIISPPKELTDGKRIDRIFVVLFEQCCLGHREDGERFIQISVSDFGINHFFNLENVGYLKYKLQNLTALSSSYSITLFNYCFNNKFRGSWEVELGELRNILNAKEESYNSYKDFNKRVLNRAVSEINEYTDINIFYSPIKAGKNVVKISFSVDYKDVISTSDETVLDNLYVGVFVPL